MHRWCVRHLLGIRIIQEGAPHAEGPVLYAMRHESFFEAIDAPQVFGAPVIFAKQELLDLPMWGKPLPNTASSPSRAIRARRRCAI